MRVYLAEARLKRRVEHCKAGHRDRRGGGEQDDPRHAHEAQERHHLPTTTRVRTRALARTSARGLRLRISRVSPSPVRSGLPFEEVGCLGTHLLRAPDRCSLATVRRAVHVGPAVRELERLAPVHQRGYYGVRTRAVTFGLCYSKIKKRGFDGS